MAKQNGKVPGTFVSHDELNELGNLLTTMRDYILSHEARLEAAEEWINEFTKAALGSSEPQPEDGVDLIHEGHDDRIDAVIGDEPADDPEEG